MGTDLGRDLGAVDQGETDGGPDGGMVTCVVEAPDMLGSQAGSVTQRIAVTNSVNDFAVVFRENRLGFDDLWMRVYEDTPGGVVEGTDFPITTDAAGFSVSSISRDPAVVAGTNGYVAAWIDSREQGLEMWTRVLNADGLPTPALQRVTTLEGDAASPALARAMDGTLLAGHIHVNQGTVTTRELHVATVGTNGALTGTWRRASSAGEFTSLGALVPGLTEGFLSGWVDGSGNARVRTVNAGGTPTGTAVTHGSALLFGLNPSVLVFARNDGFEALWAQPISEAGTPEGLLRSALTNDATGRDPGVASLSGGVVVAYRHTITATRATVIALALLNSRGERVHTELLGPTTLAGGEVSVAVNNEGRIRLAWAEADEDSTTMFTQAVQCAASL